MKIHTLSRAQAENITDHYPQYFNGDDLRVSIISIGPPGKTTGNLNESLFDNVLRLHFHDADPNVEYGQVKGMKLMSSAQAKEICRFIDLNESSDVLFVQCQAGQSRSCGVAYAIHEHFNDGDLKQGWDNFNRYVKEKVSETLRGYEKNEEYYKNIFSDE